MRRENQGQGVYSCGWLFRPELCFGFNQLFGWMTGLPVLRSKAVMNTDQGVYMFNAENGVLSVKPLMLGDDSELLDSRIELIDDQVLALETLEAELFACRLMPDN